MDATYKDTAPFPMSGFISSHDYWRPLALKYVPIGALDRLGETFVKWANRRQINLNGTAIDVTFVGFCKRNCHVFKPMEGVENREESTP